MTLADLVQASGVQPLGVGKPDSQVRGIAADSRTVEEGGVFAVMPSPSGDTHRFLPQAQGRGAAAAFVHSQEGAQAAESLGLAWAHFAPEPEGIYRAAGRAAHALLGHPCRGMKVVAVTGTNGKTTTAWILRSALEARLGRAGYLGTLGLHDGQNLTEGENTTPFPVEAALAAAACRDAGCQAIAIEASSHALHQERLAGWSFDAGLFTNLTQDHLDYHGTMEDYEEAKKRLFTEGAPFSQQEGKAMKAVLNVSDPVGARWSRDLDIPVFRCLDAEGLEARALTNTASRLSLEMGWQGRTARADLNLGGSFQVENACLACGALLALGWTLEEAAEALSSASPVPGRFESIPNSRGVDVVVDFAHTPDALAKLLDSARQVARGRVIVVFGCGGDRDRTKRPKMAAAATERADLTVLTSDNPRTEDPSQIIADARQGAAPGSEVKEIVDRREAVAWAIGQAKPGDMVLLAGKGHESYQVIGTTKHPMSDHDLAREALA